MKDVDATLNDVDTTNAAEFGILYPYLGMKLGPNIGKEERLHFAIVKRREVDDDGIPIEIPSNNPILDSR